MRRLLLIALLLLPGSAWAQVNIGAGGGGGGTSSGTNIWSGLNIFGTADGAAGSIAFNRTASCIEFEGATSNAFQTFICGGDATADQTLTVTGLATGVLLEATSSTNNVFIRSAQDTTNTSTISIGGPSGNNNSVLIGIGTLASGGNSVGIGAAVDGNAGGGAREVLIGYAAANTGTTDVIALGAGATTTGANQMVVSSSTGGILNSFWGIGVTSATAVNHKFQGTGGSGSNNAGGKVAIGPGASTGNAIPASLSLDRTIQAASSSTAQAAVNAVVVCGSKVLSTTSATAQTIATITTTSTTGGIVTMDYGNVACSGSTCDADSGIVKVAWNNNAGTVAATMTAVAVQADSDATGTLAATPTATVATNVVSIKLTPTWVTIVPTSVYSTVVFTVHSASDTVVCQ